MQSLHGKLILTKIIDLRIKGGLLLREGGEEKRAREGRGERRVRDGKGRKERKRGLPSVPPIPNSPIHRQ